MTAAKAPKESWVEMTEIVLPQHTNALGTVFGGVIMSWVDIAAAICSQRHAQMAVVTASIDALHFLAPIKLGWIVNIKACINFVHRSSCEVGIRISAEQPLTNQHYHTATAFLTMVALDNSGKPTPMPALILETELDKRRFADGQSRHSERLAFRERISKRAKEEE